MTIACLDSLAPPLLYIGTLQPETIIWREMSYKATQVGTTPDHWFAERRWTRNTSQYHHAVYGPYTDFKQQKCLENHSMSLACAIL